MGFSAFLRRGAVCLGVWGLLTGVAAHGQAAAPPAQKTAATTITLPPAPLLPESFGTPSAWKRLGDAREQTDVLQSSLPDAQVLKEDGAERVASATYQPAAGGEMVQIDVVQFGDASGAYSAFTLWAARAGRSAGVRLQGEETNIAGQGLLMRRGATLALIHDPTEQLPGHNGAVVSVHEAALQKDAAKQLELVLPKAEGTKAQIPLVPTLLPARGLATGTLRYALGPQGYAAMGGELPPGSVGFDKSAEVATANYAVRGGKGSLTLLLYPTPQLAADSGRAIEAAVNADHAHFGGAVKLRRDGPLVALASGDFTAKEAQALVERTNLQQEVSWNKALAQSVFNDQMHQTMTLLQSVVLFSIGGGIIAIVLGIFLGFGRAGVRVLMGKPAAMEPEFLRIDLGGIPPGRLAEKKDHES